MTKPRSGRLSIIPAAAVFDHRLSNADVRMFAALGAHADKKGRCWPAVSTLADEIGMSKRHALRCLQSLATHGYLQIKKRSRQSSIYQLQVTWVSPDKPQWSDTGVTDPGHGCHLSGDMGVTQNDTMNDTMNDDAAQYAFEGEVIRLNKGHLETWRKRYHAIPDLEAELAGLDSWYVGTDAKKGKGWFHRAQRSLNEKHQERLAAKQAQQSEEPKFNDGVY